MNVCCVDWFDWDVLTFFISYFGHKMMIHNKWLCIILYPVLIFFLSISNDQIESPKLTIDPKKNISVKEGQMCVCVTRTIFTCNAKKKNIGQIIEKNETYKISYCNKKFCNFICFGFIGKKLKISVSKKKKIFSIENHHHTIIYRGVLLCLCHKIINILNSKNPP